MRKGLYLSLLIFALLAVFTIDSTAATQFNHKNKIDQIGNATNLIRNVVNIIPVGKNNLFNLQTENDEEGEEVIFGSVSYNKESDQISLKRAWIFWIGFIILGFFVAATFFLKSKRQKHIEYQQNLLKSLIDNIPDTIYFKDLDSKFTQINKAQAKLLGFKNPDEAVGKSDFDFFEHAQEAFDEEQEIIKTGKPVINKVHKVERNGEFRYLSDTKIPLYDSDKKCVGTVGITRDITDVKVAEEVMLESQAKFKALFENAPLSIFRLDKNMKVVEYNHRFQKMFGYTDEELTNITKSDLLADADLEELIIDTILETKEVNTEIMMKRKNGEEFIANLTLALLEEGFKEMTIEGIVEDITQVAKARDEIIKAKDKAVEADRLKSLFLANMSHEIRTPMNAIIGFTNMLREDDITPEERNMFIDVIQSNGNALTSLIDSIVDFSKLETEQMSVSLGEFNFDTLFDSACDYTQNMLVSAEKSHIKLLRTKGSDNGIRIISDRHRLNQVLNHLISNAVKFTDNGEIEIGYNVLDSQLAIFIRDTGIGIPKNKYNTIFDRFTKVNSDKNRLFGGTGIGLTISKGLVHLMGGTIEVSSELGKGSTFTIKLPLNNGMNKS
ncbi:MAG TPA: PAS domain S-box protein [Prolixibacteraceae bacterium]|nr:PAS domain S-box protein [Bacteroidales bacterium]HPB04592.1 PAS domain S-box protein [Prolixibacteraceae bacterium]HQN92504.1 PAS domain S-box protein [Prolixibacteraceae bacterium]HUM87951.1 PAS domain S-box protein [Prolixibacteraceae bacterium]